MKILPIFIPHFGCKNRCVFCNQKHITSATNDVFEQIKIKLSQCRDKVDELAFFGGSFTCLPFEFQEELLKTASGFIKKNNAAIRISTYPETITEDIIDLLKKYNVKIIELGVQSLDKNVLEKSGRFYNPEIVASITDTLKKNHFTVGHQIIIGLPGSSRKIEFDTVEKIIIMHPDLLRIYPMVVVKDTELEKMYNESKYNPLKLNEIVDICSDIIMKLENTKIKIIRIGLHSETDFVENKIIDTGSYHPALGELIKSEYFMKKVMGIVKKYNNSDNETEEISGKTDSIENILKKSCNKLKIKVKYSPCLRTIVYGHKKVNLKKLNENNIELMSAAENDKREISVFADKKKIENFYV